MSMEIKGVNRVDLPATFVIGKEGSGLSEDSASWVPLLWDQMNSHLKK